VVAAAMSALLAYQGFSWPRVFRRGEGHTLAGIPILRSTTTALIHPDERRVCAREKEADREGREKEGKGREGKGNGQTLDFCLPRWYDGQKFIALRFPITQTLFGRLFGDHVHSFNKSSEQIYSLGPQNSPSSPDWRRQ
jgi:hypothetical protein